MKTLSISGLEDSAIVAFEHLFREKPDGGNGAFTEVLLDGLSGKADFSGAGRVTFAALNLFLSEGVSRLTQGRQRRVFISPCGIPDFALVSL